MLQKCRTLKGTAPEYVAKLLTLIVTSTGKVYAMNTQTKKRVWTDDEICDLFDGDLCLTIRQVAKKTGRSESEIRAILMGGFDESWQD